MGESDQAAPGGLGLGFLFGSWMLTALALGGLIGMLRFSAASTPVRTGQRPVVEPFVPTAVEVSPDAERTEPEQIWTYRKSKKEYVTVESYDEIPEQFRATATQMK